MYAGVQGFHSFYQSRSGQAQAPESLPLDRFRAGESTTDKRHYKLRISGLSEKKGQIKAADLIHALDALIALAERSTRLLATGEGGGKGPKPKWLGATADFTVTGLKSGSTVLGIEAPCIGETAREVFAQQEFWREQPDLGHTALELTTLAIEEVQAADSSGDRFDNAVLDAVLKFQRVVKNPEVYYELIPEGPAQGRFRLDEGLYKQASDRVKQIPASKAWVVCGQLDQIRHSAGHFQLVLDQGVRLFGKLCPAELDTEALRPLWGRQATVEGIVHFKANGQPRLIEARRLSSRAEGDTIFEKMPVASRVETKDLLTIQGKPIRSVDPARLEGAWPGDEPIEQLLSRLD